MKQDQLERTERFQSIFGEGLALNDDTTWGDLSAFRQELEGNGYYLRDRLASRTIVSVNDYGRRFVPQQEWWFKDTSTGRYSAVCLSYNGETFRPDRLFVADMAIPPLEKVGFPVYEMNSPEPTGIVLVQKIG